MKTQIFRSRDISSVFCCMKKASFFFKEKEKTETTFQVPSLLFPTAAAVTLEVCRWGRERLTVHRSPRVKVSELNTVCQTGFYGSNERVNVRGKFWIQYRLLRNTHSPYLPRSPLWLWLDPRVDMTRWDAVGQLFQSVWINSLVEGFPTTVSS